MQDHIEKYPGLMKTGNKRLNQYEMTGTGDRQEFRQPLHQSKQKRIQEIHVPQTPFTRRFLCTRAAFTKEAKIRRWPGSVLIRSGCHCTPSRNGCEGRSIASTTPSGAFAETWNPLPSRFTAW